jgi:glyoxylase-like metal-dependent hydrolase (beta-lactamase superfamily II)
MPKTILALLIASSLLVFSVKAQERDDARLKPAERNRTGTLRQLIPGYYVFSSTSFNSGVIATSEGVVVLDALSSEAIARQEREAIASVIKQPVRFLVSSTFHNNYTWGNAAYHDVIKVGHENYRADLLAQMERDRFSPENQKARLPQVTYRDRLTIHLGGKEIQILYLGRGHTRGDSIIFVPQDRIAYVSELFFSDQFLYINDGYGLDWLKTLDAIEALPADILVPDPFRRIPKKPDKASIVFVRSWWICATPCSKKSLAGQPKTKLPLRSNFPSTKRCRDTHRKEKSPCGGCTRK